MSRDFSEEFIQKSLRRNFLSKSTKKYEMFNLFVYNWESDYLCITNSGYAYECEIKISKADFNKDKNKQKKHLILEGKIDNKFKPNYFYYVVPKDLINIEDVPQNYGLIYVTWSGFLEIVKQAPKIHNEKTDIVKLKLTEKFYYNMWSWRDKWFDNDCAEMKRQINQLQKDVAYLDEQLSLANCKMNYEDN